MISKPATRRGGFTLVEAVLALALAAVALVAGFDLLWQVLSARATSVALREAQGNAQLGLRRMEAELRSAASLQSGASVFGVNPGRLAVDYPGSANDVVFDTATTTVAVGGSAVEIRILRVTVGGGSPLALTSNQVDVDKLIFTNLTRPGYPASLRIELAVRTVHQGGSPWPGASFTLLGGVTLRQ